MIRTVSNSTQHRGSKLIGPVGGHVQEGACASKEAAQGATAGKENKKEGQQNGKSSRKVRTKDCVWPRKFFIEEVDKDVIEECFFRL